MSKKILEQVLEHILNKEEDKAQDLLHSFFVEKGRSIYEGLIEDDQVDEDEVLETEEINGNTEDDFENDINAAKEDIASEEMFSEEGDDEARQQHRAAPALRLASLGVSAPRPDDGERHRRHDQRQQRHPHQLHGHREIADLRRDRVASARHLSHVVNRGAQEHRGGLRRQSRQVGERRIGQHGQGRERGDHRHHIAGLALGLLAARQDRRHRHGRRGAADRRGTGR